MQQPVDRREEGRQGLARPRRRDDECVTAAVDRLPGASLGGRGLGERLAEPGRRRVGEGHGTHRDTVRRRRPVGEGAASLVMSEGEERHGAPIGSTHHRSGILERMTLRIVSLTCALVLTLGACSGNDDNTKKSEDPTDPDKTTAAEVVAINPLTGRTLKKAPKNPVFVVKIDNTRASAPQTNVDQADLVVEQ